MVFLTNKISVIIFISVVSISGCVSVTEPVSMGEGRYMITLNARGGFSTDGELLSRTVTKANAFCKAKGQEAEVLETKNSGVQMWTPQNNQVVFTCIEIN